MITFLESAGLIIYVTILAVTKKTSFMSLFHGMLVYDIILPYAFFMNTSANKNRIVENGWKNVFTNLFGCWSRFASANEVQQIDMSKATRTNEITQRNCGQKKDDNDNEVFTITKASDGNITGEFKHFNALHCPINNDAEASLSSGKPKTLNKEDLPQNSKKFHTRNNMDLQNNYSIAHNLVSNMANNTQSTDKENVFIQYFKQFVMVTDYNKQGRKVSEIELVEEFFPIPIRRSKDRKRHKKVKGKIKNKGKLSHDSLVNDTGHTSVKFDSNHAFEKRKTQRIELLRKLSCLGVSNEQFDRLAEDLIDLEESFIQNY